MKKTMIFTAVLTALMLQPVAYADVPDGVTDYSDNYYAIENTLDVDTADDSATIVLILKVDSTDDTEFEDSDIVYVNQDDSTFSSMSGFMIKNNPEEGLYKVILDDEISYFEIGTIIKTTDIPAVGNDIVEYSDSNGNTVYKKGFLATVSADDYLNCTSIKLVDDQVVGAWSLADNEADYDTGKTVTSGSAEIILGIQINNIPYKVIAENLEIYLSDDGVEAVSEEVAQ